MTREEMMRPWADALCPGCGGNGMSSFDCICHGGGMATPECSPCPTCETKQLDLRFDALRGEHQMYPGVEMAGWCFVCSRWDEDKAFGTYCLRTDLGALVRVAAACGLAVAYMGPVVGGFNGHQVVLQEWHGYFNPTDDKHLGQGDTDEDAVAAALVAALGKP